MYVDHDKLPPNIPKHDFHQQLSLTVTGKTDDDVELIPEEKSKVIKNVFTM